MYPVLWESGSFILPAWHFFFIVGAIAAYILFAYLGRTYAPDIAEKHLSNIFVLGYLGGYFGARIFSMVWEQDLQGAREIIFALFTLGPMTFYGGAIGSAMVIICYCIKRKVNVGEVFDLAIPAALLGLAYGRIGCFLNGDDYGKPVPEQWSGSWWTVRFPNLGDGIYRYPSQIIETLFCLVLVFILIVYFKRISQAKGDGWVGWIGCVGYAVYRFFAEYLRGDERGWWIHEVLSTSQGVSLVILFFGAFFYFRSTSKVGASL